MYPYKDKLDVKLLHLFNVLMTERNVSRAAQKLSISQPAMSLVLRRLRTLFKDPLFVRAHNEMVPTPRALELAVPVRKILEDLGTLLDVEPAFDPRTAKAHFALTIPSYISFLLLPKLMKVIERRAPGVTLEARSSNRDLAIEWLEKGEIDFRIGWISSPPEALRCKMLYKDRFVVLVSRTHPRIRRALSVEEFCATPHIRTMIHKSSDSGRLIDQALGALGLRLNIAAVVQDSLTVPHMIAGSNLIALVPSRIANAVVRQMPIRILQPPVSLPEQSIALYWHERTQNGAAHKWLRAEIGEICRGF
jgi:DNA-binding transcriptional LysR family regulator